jgi:hypothetical protein
MGYVESLMTRAVAMALTVCAILECPGAAGRLYRGFSAARARG